jgi:hypothetical protein
LFSPPLLLKYNRDTVFFHSAKQVFLQIVSEKTDLLSKRKQTGRKGNTGVSAFSVFPASSILSAKNLAGNS